ncbi:hypothetical protein FOB41_07510 [Agrobacterium pusense]|uniref:Uncharacterized protein n=1 Tax=Agrobacterium pusense TaxID=648995 RepID=A0A6H0ZJL4_9HYPH|nr:hypothetical protein [Agrobacterium pusense]QIX20988.1 hypothetical protein FOB41_07510 [Agrobacterium pusense]
MKKNSGQLCLFAWADAKPSNVIYVMPALIRKAAMETIYNIPRPKGGGEAIPFKRSVA